MPISETLRQGTRVTQVDNELVRKRKRFMEESPSVSLCSGVAQNVLGVLPEPAFVDLAGQIPR
jgi:hypothetical protein